MFFIKIEDLAANAFIEILKENEELYITECYVTLSELEAYGRRVVKYLSEHGTEAVLVLSREDTLRMFREYPVFFEEAETENGSAIALKSGRTVSDLIKNFRTYIPMELLLAFMNTKIV